MSPPNRVAQALGTQTAGAPGPVTPPGGRTPPSMGPAQPKSPFGNMPVSTGSDEVRFKPDDLVRLGGELVGRLGDDLTQARRHVNAAPREVEAGAFTTFCAHLAHAYVQGVEYADVDLVTKLRQLKEVQDGLNTTAKIALDTSTAAAFVIPTAWPSVSVMYMAQSDPSQLWDAAEDWKKAADKIKSARDRIDDELRSLPHDSWYGKDRDAFEKKMNDYANQLMLAFAYAYVMFIVLTIMALLIAMFIMMMMVCALVLVAFAIWVIIARILAAIPAYGQAELAVAEEGARLAARQVRQMLRMGEKALEKTGTTCAAAIAAATGIDVVGQMLTGNTNAFPDFFEATVRSADDVAISRLALIEQKLTGQLMRGRAVGGTGYGKWRLPMQRLPQKYKSLWSGIGGAKGIWDTGLPYTSDGVLNPGAPLANKGITSVTGQEGYGDDYVKRTNPIPADTGKELD